MGERPFYPQIVLQTNRTKHLEKSPLPPSENLALFYSPWHMLDFFLLHTSEHDSECKPGYKPSKEKLLFLCWPLPTAGT